MPIKVKPLKEIPAEAFLRQTRSSLCSDTIAAIKASPTQKAEISGETPEELDKFYKTLIQWRSRHREEGVQFRKTKDVLYIWIGDAHGGESGSPGKAAAGEQMKVVKSTKRDGQTRSQ